MQRNRLKSLTLSSIGLTLLLAIWAGCYDPPDVVSYEIGVGEKLVHDEHFTLVIEEIIEDTRCDDPVNCMDPGTLDMRLIFTIDDQDESALLSFQELSETIGFAGYQIQFLEVLPVISPQAPEGYMFRLAIRT